VQKKTKKRKGQRRKKDLGGGNAENGCVLGWKKDHSKPGSNSPAVTGVQTAVETLTEELGTWSRWKNGSPRGENCLAHPMFWVQGDLPLGKGGVGKLGLMGHHRWTGLVGILTGEC